MVVVLTTSAGGATSMLFRCSEGAELEVVRPPDVSSFTFFSGGVSATKTG